MARERVSSRCYPALRKEAVQAAFEPFGSVKHVQMCPGPAHAPKTAGPLVDYYNYAIVTYRDQSSGGGARRDGRRPGDV